MTNSNNIIPYEYQNAPVPGGGFVTGFCFHPAEPNILYARTDIGGVYRYDFFKDEWTSLINHVKTTGKWESLPLSIALDPAHPDWLYIAAGDWNTNYLCRSKDRGEHFEYFLLPAGVHGNNSGRGTGERLMVDPHNPEILFFGSQRDGLLISEDYGESWRPLPVGPEDGAIESDIAFVWIDPRFKKNGRSQTLVVATAGKDNSPGNNKRGVSLYISKNAGKTFHSMPGQPSAGDYGNYPGFVGQRACFSGKYLFVTMAAVENSWNGWHGYACDMGGAQKGCVLRYELTDQGDITDYKNVTPDTSFITGQKTDISNISGFGGINADYLNPEQLICSTQCCGQGDIIFYSKDFGENWTPILHDLEKGKMDFRGVPYMKPEYNGNANIIHWLSDLKIDPFDSNRAVFNTGTGIFMTENLKDAMEDKTVVWRPCCTGVEETVHLNVYSPPGGEIKLIDIIGDLGGFAFSDLTRPVENSFADENGNRYITCLNADFPDNNPQLVAVTSRGNWKGKTTGGLIWSEDQCKTWRRLSDPAGITERIDKLIDEIRKPNTNSGWTAISSDARTLVWSVGERFNLPVDAVVFTENLGSTWTKVKIYDKDRKEVADPSKTFKVLSDRVDPELFYGFGDDSLFYISTDRARTFYEILIPAAFPKLGLGGMDGRMPAEIRAESDKSGIVWISTGECGLWKIAYNKYKKEAKFMRISKEGDSIFRQGMGKNAPESTYKTLYVNGIIDGTYGFYRSLDEGKTWQRINNDNQMYGDIRSITGDSREFGRFYLATGSRGVLWGQPVA